MKFNFEQNSSTTHKFVFKPVSYNAAGTTYTESNKDPIASQIQIREKPSANSNVLATIQEESAFTMQREWATGNNKWAFIKTQDGVEGYVMTKYTVPIDDSISGKLLRKSNIDLKPMTQMAKLLFEATPWMENEFPKHHTEYGEWWVTVTLPYTCLEEGSLGEKKNEAKVRAIEQIYQYFNVEPKSGIIPSVDAFNKGFLSAYVKDFYLGSRPGSNLMMLVVIPAVYVEYLKKNTEANVVTQPVQEQFSISLEANSLQDLSDLQAEIKACLAGLYQKYINSTISASNFSFENEIFKQIQGIEKIKFLLKENDINLESASNKKSGKDNCEETATNRTIKVCFNSEYQLIAVYYYNNSGEKTVLSNGFNAVKNSHPFNEPRFGLMFLKHREICSSAPSLKTFFTDYVTDPQPEVTTVTWSEKSQLPLSNLASAELQVYIDSALFLVGLAQEFGNLFDLKSLEDTLSCYGDPSQSKLVQAYKLKAAEFRDSQIMYTSDVVNIASYLCNDLGDIEEFDKIDWKEIGEEIFGTAEGWGEWWKSLSFSDWRWPTFSFIKKVKENAEEAAGKAKEQVEEEFLKFFKTLWCELLLVAGAAATAGIGYGIYLSIKEDQNGNVASSFPSPAETASFDYGAENVNDALSESIGAQDPEQYEASLIVLFRNCGVDLQAGEKQLAREYLDSISSMLAPVEVLALLDGTAASSLTNTVSKYTQANFPAIHQQKNTSSKIAEFFACLGGNVTTEVKDKVQNKIIEKIENIDICVDICEELKKQMKEKCPDPEVYNAICEKEFASKIDKYQQIFAIIDDDCSIQPKFFNNKETGEKGIFSGNKPANIDIMVEKMSQTTLDPPQIAIKSDSVNYFTKQQYVDVLSALTGYLTKNKLAYESLINKDKFELDFGSISDVTMPNYILKSDGSETLNGVSLDNKNNQAKVEIDPEPLSDEINNILTSDPNYDEAISNLGLSRHRTLFYSLIQDYYKNNFGSDPIPFAVSEELPDTKGEYSGGMFSVVFEQMLQRYARKVGFTWQGDQSDFLSAYSKALSDNSSYISGVDDARELVSLYYDFGDYDDPNDSETKSSLQVSLMNALLHTYFGLYIMEYFCLSMPFYEIFYSYDGTVAALDDRLRSFAEKYITEKINLDLNESQMSKQEFESIFNQSYDDIKSKQEFELPNYTGSDRGIKYYLNSNLEGTYERFIQTLNNSELKKTKNYIQGGSFVYSNTKSFQTHDYAGIRTLTSDNQLGGENFSSIPTSRPSLFKDHSDNGNNIYNHFKNGMFFIQNYFILEDQDPGLSNGYSPTEYLEGRKDYLKGIVNVHQLSLINALLTSADQKLPLRDIFKSVRRGSRLCFGIAYDDNDDSADSTMQKFAKDLFLSYAISGPGVDNNGKIPNKYLKSSEQVSQFDKSIICVDGDVPQDFQFKTDSIVPDTGGSSGLQSAIEAVEIYAVKKSGGIDDTYYPSPDGTFSVVIPVFSLEEELEMSKPWLSFYNTDLITPLNTDVSDLYEFENFKNLNDQLINSDKMKALTELCFPLKNMIDFNAISSMQYLQNIPEISNSFSQSKQFMMQSVKAVNDGKKI